MKIFGGYHIDCVLNARLKVLQLQVWVVFLNYLRKRDPFTYQFQDILNRDSRPGNAGLAKMNSRAYRDAAVHRSVFLCSIEENGFATQIPFPLFVIIGNNQKAHKRKAGKAPINSPINRKRTKATVVANTTMILDNMIGRSIMCICH